jgi:hypothetical protein
MPPVTSPGPDDHLQHSLLDRAFDLNASRTTLGVRDLRIQSFHPQATMNDLSYGPSYSHAQIPNQDLYPSRISGSYPQAHSLQESQRRYQGAPHWYLGSNQYLPSTPINSQLMNSQPVQCHAFSSTLNFPLPQGSPYLPSLPLPAICLPQQEIFNESTEVSRVCEVNRSMGKEEGIDERGDTLRLPHHPHGYQEYLHSPVFGGNNLKQDCRDN